MMHQIHLHGHLKEEFGAVFKFDIATAGEAVRALNCAFPGRFVAQMQKGSYRMVRGNPEDGMHIGVQHLNKFKLGQADLHIIPVAAGSKNNSGKGDLEIGIGVAIIAAAVFFSAGTLLAPIASIGTMGAAGALSAVPLAVYGDMAAVGLAVTMLGVSTLLSKPPVNNDNTTSYTFTGPVNVDQQGAAVPLIFGTCMVGSQAISAGYQVEDIGSYTVIDTTTPMAPDAQATAEEVAQVFLSNSIF